jgi:diacylglycerol kinase (ATP)
MPEESQKKFSVSERQLSFSYAWKGLMIFFRTQHNARIHAVCAVLAIGCGFLLHINKLEWALILLCIGFVFSAECMNTAIEFLTDLVSPGFSIKAGQVKDLAAGAVLLSALTAFIIGTLVFAPKILVLLGLTG